MNKRKEQSILYITLSVVFFICFFILFLRVGYRDMTVNLTERYSENGIWDLRDVNFDTTVIRLSGNVEYIEGKILSPEAFAVEEDNILIGDPRDVDTARTARVTIQVPDESKFMIHTYGDHARTIYGNGEWLGESGVVGETAGTFKAGYRQMLLEVKPIGNQVELIIQGANFAHVLGSSYSDIYIGSPENVSWYVNFETESEVLVIGMLFTLFIIFIILAFIFKSYLVNLSFALLCFVWCIRFGVIGTKFFYNIFPQLEWEVAFKIEYLSVPITAILIINIVKEQFVYALNKRVLKVFQVIFISWILIFTLLEAYIISRFLVL